MKKIDENAKKLGFNTIKRNSETCVYYYLEDENAWATKNDKEDKLCVEVCYCADACKSKNSLPVLWQKNGRTKELLTDYWSFDTFVTDKDDMCWRDYDPQTKLSEDKKRLVIDFDWMMRATDENFEKIMKEVLRRFFSK